jgi:RimJ/RimL family protein N-acetyltransferase
VIEAPVIMLGEDAELSAWRAEDAPAHRRFSVDADAARFLGWTVEEARAAPDSYYEEGVRNFQREWDAGTRYSLAIRLRADGEAVGAVELRPVGDRSVHVSYLVVPEYRRAGLASRGLEAMLAWGARELGLCEAHLGCHVDNVASRRVAEKCAFDLVRREGDELRFRRDLAS